MLASGSRVGRSRGAGRVVAGGLAAVGERANLGCTDSVSCVAVGLFVEACIADRREVVAKGRGAHGGRQNATCL